MKALIAFVIAAMFIAASPAPETAAYNGTSCNSVHKDVHGAGWSKAISKLCKATR